MARTGAVARADSPPRVAGYLARRRRGDATRVPNNGQSTTGGDTRLEWLADRGVLSFYAREPLDRARHRVAERRGAVAEDARQGELAERPKTRWTPALLDAVVGPSSARCARLRPDGENVAYGYWSVGTPGLTLDVAPPPVRSTVSGALAVGWRPPETV